MLDSLSLQSVDGSHHGESEFTDLSLVYLSVEHNRKVDRNFVGRDILLDVDEVHLWQFDWVLNGRNNLVNSHEMNLRDVNRNFLSWHDLLDCHEMNLWQFDWHLNGLRRFDLNLLDLDGSLSNGLLDDHDGSHHRNDLFVDHWRWSHDRRSFNNNVLHDFGRFHDDWRLNDRS